MFLLNHCLKKEGLNVRIIKSQLIILLISGCSLAPNYQRPEVPLPKEYTEVHVDGESVANLKWWGIFGDPKLQTLLKEALNNNRELGLALARIEESKALVGFTRADQFPFLNVKSAIGRNDSGSDVAGVSAFNILGDLTFEVDLWGKLRNATAAQRAILLSTSYAMQTVTISLISQVSELYFRLIDLDHRVQISKGTLTNRRKAKNIISERFSKGIVSELELNQSQIEELSVDVNLTILERERRLVEHALLQLLGRSSGVIERSVSLEKIEILKNMPADIPAKILERRPDLLALEENIRAQFMLEGVAEAQRYPNLQILGTLGLGNFSGTDIFNEDAKSWSIGGNLFSPLLNLNKNQSRVDAQKARIEQAKRSYEGAVLSSIREVEDALIEIQTFEKEYKQRQTQIKYSINANTLTRARYDNGITSYVEVLDIERSRYNAELGASVAYRSYLSSLVKLYRTLGGGWDPEQLL
jgi:multidrug efflux system outer membrane protein